MTYSASSRANRSLEFVPCGSCDDESRSPAARRVVTTAWVAFCRLSWASSVFGRETQILLSSPGDTVASAAPGSDSALIARSRSRAVSHWSTARAAR